MAHTVSDECLKTVAAVIAMLENENAALRIQVTELQRVNTSYVTRNRELERPPQMSEAEWRRHFVHNPHPFRADRNGECFDCGYPQLHDYHVKAMR